jgi:Protein of unknown function (DUF4242)
VPTYVVEAYEPRGRGAEVLSGLEARARAAAIELSTSGSPARYVRAIFLPEDEICLHVFEAPSREVVREAARRAGLTEARITEAVERGFPAPPSPEAG